MQALSLSQLIEKGVARGTLPTFQLSDCSLHGHHCTEGYIGMALVGGAAAVGAVLLAGLIRRATRK